MKTVAIWQLALICVLVVSGYLPPRLSNQYTVFKLFTHQPSSLQQHLLGSWANFDGIHYLTIAAQGYSDQARFLPFYPALIHFFSFLTGQNRPYSLGQLAVAQTISTMALVMALFFLIRLVKLDLPANSAWRTTWYLLLFPSSFFLGAVYGESTFLLLAILALWSARQQRWGRAGLFTSLALVTRLTGVAVMAAVGWEFYATHQTWFKSHKNVWSNSWKIVKTAWPILLSPVWLATYSLYNRVHWGSWLYFVTAHGQLGNSRATSSLVFPAQTVWRYLKILSSLSFSQYELWLAGLELATFIFGWGLVYLVWKQRLRTSYLIFSVTALLIPSLSGTFSGLPRYLLIIFPFFIALAQTKNNWLKFSYMIISPLLLAGLLTLFSLGYFVA